MDCYFRWVVAVAQRYVRPAVIATLVSMMLCCSLTFLLAWSALLLAFWSFDVSL